MKKYINLFLSVVVAASLGSCSKEDPFVGEDNEGMGKVLKSALNVEIKNEEGIPALYAPATRAVIPAADDFTVDFIRDGQDTPYSSYKYSEMPEVVDLPVGAFTAVAHYGDNASAAWEAPYFKGETKFIVVADKITDTVEPITASLSNVRVSIVFDSSLKAVMSSDSKVTVKVGEVGSLDFTSADAERSGYFAFVENSCSLTATFSGNVDGDKVTESKVYDTVQPGSHYRITFKLHGFGEGDPGEINGGVTVDAEVEVVDMNVSLDPDDTTIVDDMRPVEGTDGPDNPDNPDEPVAPAITSASPEAGSEYASFHPVDLSVRNDVTDDLYCALKIISTADEGIKSFVVTINSEKLTAEELESFGLSQNLDLVNPDPSYAGALEGLGFPINVGGQKDVVFNITGFLTMLSALGPGDHDFVVTVSDANGTSTATLKLRTN